MVHRVAFAASNQSIIIILIKIFNNKLSKATSMIQSKQEQWRRQDLLRGGAKLEVMSWGTHGELQGGSAAAR